MFSNVFIDRTRNAARGSTHGAAAKDVAIVKSCVLALVSLAFKLSQLAMPKVSTYTRTRIELLTVVSFRHVIINSSDREEACTKFTTAEYYFDVRAKT